LISLLIITNETDQARNLSSEITRRGYACSVTPKDENTLERVMKQAPKLVLIDVDGLSVGSGFCDLCQKIRQERHIPVIALIPREMLNNLDFSIDIDDFIVKPLDAAEVITRAKRILQQTGNMNSEQIIKCGDLVIDLARCEVSLSDRLITLTFKEYQLLKFLADNQGKVFTRQELLDKVWGWDYYGGDRTVDVHIRRLRSKIEDSTHTFIETVRNIGYKLRENV
jgi:DNA-binding response OmpR family regulator